MKATGVSDSSVVVASMNPNRIRVLDFENEAEERLVSLKDVETEIVSVGKLRSRWLSSVSKTDEVETETFRLQLDGFRANSELADLSLALDQLEMESLYESQTLEYLVQATKPLDDGEHKDGRSSKLEHLTKTNLDELCNALRRSVDYRAKISKKMHDCALELSKLRVNHDSKHTEAVAELQERIANYAERMKEAVIKSKKQHKKITGEYLVLRHNARVAKEVLQRSQNEAQFERQMLQEKLRRLEDEAASQRERMESAAMAELKIMTDDIRNAVLRKETEVNEQRRSIEALQGSRKQTSRMLRKAIKSFDAKRVALEKSRKIDVEAIKGELKQLREMCSEVESELELDRLKKETFGIFQFEELNL